LPVDDSQRKQDNSEEALKLQISAIRDWTFAGDPELEGWIRGAIARNVLHEEIGLYADAQPTYHLDQETRDRLLAHARQDAAHALINTEVSALQIFKRVLQNAAEPDAPASAAIEVVNDEVISSAVTPQAAYKRASGAVFDRNWSRLRLSTDLASYPPGSNQSFAQDIADNKKPGAVSPSRQAKFYVQKAASKRGDERAAINQFRCSTIVPIAPDFQVPATD